MAKKSVKKVDVKKVAKLEVSKEIAKALGLLGIHVEEGEDFGFTVGTLVAHMSKADVQIKLITPKAGIDRYEKLVEEEDEQEEEIKDESSAPGEEEGSVSDEEEKDEQKPVEEEESSDK